MQLVGFIIRIRGDIPRLPLDAFMVWKVTEFLLPCFMAAVWINATLYNTLALKLKCWIVQFSDWLHYWRLKFDSLQGDRFFSSLPLPGLHLNPMVSCLMGTVGGLGVKLTARLYHLWMFRIREAVYSEALY